MTPMDGYDAMAAARRADLEAAAVRHRQQRACRAATRHPSLTLRLYTRLWWASRPRFETWGTPPNATGGSLAAQ